jgi:tRNA (adenine22-N1)-methyltransferase
MDAGDPIEGPRLSPRLAAAADLVPDGSRPADVGSDHAYLPIRLLLDRRVAWAVATERTAARLEPARRAAERFGAEGLALRAGDGLEPLLPEDRIDVLVLAGLGGRSARGILEPRRLARLGVRRLVVQPQTCLAEVREHLDRSGWTPVAETVVADRGRFYTIGAAEAGAPRSVWEHPTLDRRDLWAAGPVLVRAAPPAALAAWRAERSRLAAAGRPVTDPALARASRILDVLERISRERDG